MKSFLYNPAQTPALLRTALAQIAEDFPIKSAPAEKANVIFQLGGDGPSFRREGKKNIVQGRTVPQALRALASLRGFEHEGKAPASYSETARFDTLGLMIDCSRNGVPTPVTVKRFLRSMALMGMNLLMLYTEDTYEVPGEPHLGYLRGRYTQKELRDFDNYAHTLGIEMIPCIQTLAHLAQPLRWFKQFCDITGTGDVLHVGNPKTYKTLERWIKGAAAPYRSKRIHVGMDEAALGHGKNKPKIGKTEFDLMVDHLDGVVKITNKLKLKPMIWSDMFFTIAREHGGKVPPKVAARIPKGLDLVYWDYYQCDPEGYKTKIDQHRTMGKEPIFAPGLWTDYAFWEHFSHARLDTDCGMLACKERGVREAFTTLWGDDGMACNMLSGLIGLQHFAEHGYRDNVGEDDLKRMFRGCCGLDSDAWRTGEQIDATPTLVPTLRQWSKHLGTKLPPYVDDILDARGWNFFGQNPANYLTWQDPLLGIYDCYVQGLPVAAEYNTIAANIAKARRAGREENKQLAFVHALSRLIELKGDIGVRLREAYVKKDKKKLAHLAGSVLPEAIRRAQQAHEAHRRQWFSMFKPNGWEVQDIRWSGLEGRLRSAKQRIDDYLAGRVDSLPELAEERQLTGDAPKGTLGYGGPNYRKIISPSVIT